MKRYNYPESILNYCNNVVDKFLTDDKLLYVLFSFNYKIDLYSLVLNETIKYLNKKCQLPLYYDIVFLTLKQIFISDAISKIAQTEYTIKSIDEFGLNIEIDKKLDCVLNNKIKQHITHIL